jgi:hypothetical protein
VSAQAPVPGVSDFLRAYSDAIRGERGQRQNVRRGGTLDLVGGSSALVWAALAARDRDLFRANLVDAAQGEDLDRQVLRRYGVVRLRESRGAGEAIFKRPTAAAGADTIDAGTRIRVQGAAGFELYAVAQTTSVGATALLVAVPIQATRPGPGVAVSASGASVSLDDSIFDASLVPVSLTCGDGVLEETASAYVARARATKRAGRVGYRRSVTEACKAAGADVVVILAPDTFGGDQAITNVYVGDAGYTTSTELLDACYVAAESVRVAGCDMQFLPMQVTPVSLEVVATLWDQPAKFDQLALKRDAIDALVGSFAARADFWLFSTDSLSGEVVRASGGAVQSVAITPTPPAPAATFPAVLPRFTLTGSSIALTLQGP